MRDPETDRLLRDVQGAVVAARKGGVTTRACIFDATTAAVDVRVDWPTQEARHIADNACRAIEPPDAKGGPKPSLPPAAARGLFWLANRIAARKATR